MSRHALLTAIMALACVAADGVARAQVIYSTGFEAPTFTTGTLSGQGGWTVLGPTNLTVVENTFASTGTQAVRINALGNIDSGGAVLPVSFGIGNGPMVDVSVDQYFTTSTHRSGGQQFVVFTPGGGYMAEAVMVNDGQLLIHSGLGNQSFAGPTLDAWHHWEFRLDFVGQKFDFLLDGTTVASSLPFGASSTSAGFVTFQYALPGDDHRYIDNLSISVAPVPEPSTLMLGFVVGAFGLGTVAWRRRGKSSQNQG
ncbi:MAG: PEP-CTERM sorting domain-containing protein [Isosphaeraceae bacterium]